MALTDHFGVEPCDHFQRFVGSSVGSFLATLLACGHTVQSLVDVVGSMKVADIFSKDPTLLVTQFALNDGQALRHTIASLLAQRGHREDITFKGLFEATGKHVIIAATDLCSAGIVYLDHESAPTMPVAKAVLASMSLPPLFAPVPHDSMLLSDGGLMDNFPMALCDPSKSIGFKIQWYIDSAHPYDMTGYFTRILACMHMASVQLLDRSISRLPYMVHIDVGQVNVADVDVDVGTLVFKGYRDAIKAVAAWPSTTAHIPQSPVKFFDAEAKRRHMLPKYVANMLNKFDHNADT